MSLRSQPFSGAGRLSKEAVRKLNSMLNRSEVFGGNNTSPVTRGPNGTVNQYRKRLPYRDETALELMFAIDSASGTTVTVRAGVVLTWAGGSELYTLTTIDGGSSLDPADTVSITGVNATQWIIGTLDNATAPTTFTISKTGSSSFPTDATGKVIAIAKITCTGGVISSYFQAHVGPWERWASGGMTPDNTSTELCPALKPGGGAASRAGLLQWYGLDDSGTGGAHHDGNPDGQYALFGWTKIYNDEPVPVAYCTLNELFDNADFDLCTAFVAWVAAYVAAHPSLPEHTDLLNTHSTPGALGLNSDHNYQYLVKGADWLVTGNDALDQLDNNYCTAIGRSWNSLALDLTNSQLHDGTRATLDWANRQLLYGDWTVTVGNFTVTVGDINVTAGDVTVASGDIECTAGTIRISNGTYVKLSAASVLLGADTVGVGKSTGEVDVLFTTLKVNGKTYQEISAADMRPADKILVSR